FAVFAPPSSSGSYARMTASWSPAASAALPFICAMRLFSCAVRPDTASALAISARASRPLRCLMSACAACSGLPTSGLTPCCACASGMEPANTAKARDARSGRTLRVIAGLSLVEELLGADEADLGDAVALRGGHHAGDVLVRHQ